MSNSSIDILASKIAPRLVSILDPKRDIYINKIMSRADIPGWAHLLPIRKILESCWPIILNEVPELTRDGIQLVSDEFGRMNVNDLISFLADHAKLSPQTAREVSRRLSERY